MPRLLPPGRLSWKWLVGDGRIAKHDRWQSAVPGGGRRDGNIVAPENSLLSYVQSVISMIPANGKPNLG